jgi:hypothetical protein
MKTKTFGYKGTARIVGILYIIGTVAGILSASFLGIRNEPDYLAKIAENPNSLIIGATFVLIMGFALAMIPVFLYPVLKKHNEAAGVGYIIFRGGLETCTNIINVICYLALASLGAAYAAGADIAQLLSAGTALKAIITPSINTFAFGIGALILYTALYKYKLIPKWISVFGLIAILLHIASGGLVLFGLQEPFDTGSIIMNLPIAVQEMIMAVWLIIKGFNCGHKTEEDSKNDGK